MRIPFLPKTTPGRWSVFLSIAFLILTWAKVQDGIPLPTFAIATLGLAGLVLATIAIFKKRDRSISGVLPLMIGALIAVWVAAEFMFPH